MIIHFSTSIYILTNPNSYIKKIIFNIFYTRDKLSEKSLALSKFYGKYSANLTIARQQATFNSTCRKCLFSSPPKFHPARYGLATCLRGDSFTLNLVSCWRAWELFLNFVPPKFPVGSVASPLPRATWACKFASVAGCHFQTRRSANFSRLESSRESPRASVESPKSFTQVT